MSAHVFMLNALEYKFYLFPILEWALLQQLSIYN